MGSFILSIDQGTTSTRACLVSEEGKIVSVHQEPFAQIYPKSGWVEHDAELIWSTVEKTISEIFKDKSISPKSVLGCGITNQRETVVAWDSETHKPLYKAIVWQCRRTQEFCEKLKKQNKEKQIQKKTGLLLDPYFSATKMHWLLKNVDSVKKARQRGVLRFGTIDTYIAWKLSAGQSYITDVSNASRTMLMNLETLDWDSDLLKLFGIRRSELPQIGPSSGMLGKVHKMAPLEEGTPIAGIAGDQQAALFGQACFQSGEVKCTYGTGSFILLNTGSCRVRSKNKMLTTVAWQLNKAAPVYALEGGAFICGAAVQWLRDGLNLFKTSGEIERLAAEVSETDGVYFVPALVGLGAPYWRSEARGVICGIHRGTQKAHIARATLEAMALQNVEIFKSMEEELGEKIKSVKVDGGASVNDLLVQMQADFSGLKVIRPENRESTVMGAAYLAGLGCGLWKDLRQVQQQWKQEREFAPKLSSRKRAEKLQEWQSAVKKSF